MQLQKPTLTFLLGTAVLSQNIFDKVTSKAGDIFGDITDKGGDIIESATEFVDTVFDDHNTRDASSVIQSVTRVANSILAEVTGEVSERVRDAEDTASSAANEYGRDSGEARSALSQFSSIVASVTRDSNYPAQTGSNDDNNNDNDDDENDSAASGYLVPGISLVGATFLAVLGLM